MDCVIESCLPPRRPSPSAHARSPSVSGGGDRHSPRSSNHRARPRHRRPQHQQQADSGSSFHSESHEAAAEASSASFSSSAQHSLKADQPSCFSEGCPHLTSSTSSQQQQLHTKLPLSESGGSASNLTTLGLTYTSASVTGSSEHSTPVSGASSHQQHLAAKAHQQQQQQRLLSDAHHPRASLVDSRSNSSSRPAHDIENEEEESSSVASPVAAATASSTVHHFCERSTPSSKRPRQAPQQPSHSQQQQHLNAISDDASARAMHFPDISTFADSSPTRHSTPMAAISNNNDSSATHNGNVSPAPNASGSSHQHLRVHDAVEYEEEISRAVLQQPQQRDGQGAEERDTYTTTAAAAPSTAATTNNNGSVHSVAPDATPQEPPPKRFAVGDEGNSFADLMCAGAPSNESSPQQPQHPRQQSSSDICQNEEDENGREDTAHHALASSSSSRSTERKKTASSSSASPSAVRRSAHAHSQQSQQQQQRESRRKARLTSGNGFGSSSNLASGMRYNNDSITASIPYDPARFHSSSASTPSQPPQLQQQQHESAVDEEHNGAQATTDAEPEQHSQQQQQRDSESMTSCATPPPATEQRTRPADAPPRPAIKLTETRYAFLALSFMMRMLCKLHKGEPIPSSDFHSHCIPPMSVTMYVQRLVRYCACSGEALLCGFLLLLKYAFHSGHPITIYNAHRLLITSIVLGIKLRDDVYYSNVYYARIGGISGREMHKLEVLFLEKLDWETQVHEDEYMALLNVLEEIGMEADPTPEQLAAFAAAFPEKVAAYTPDEDDDELEEAAAKLQQQQQGSAATSSSSPFAAPAAAPGASTLTAERKVLRGAYRLHQWHTLVEPWMAQLQQHVFAKKEENTLVAAAAWKEEGERWQQYYREDEEASARLRRENSSSAWLSPLSVQKRATSGATASATATATAAGGARTTEPPYQSFWPHPDSLPHMQQQQQQHQNSSSGQSQQQQQPNPRYNNFINFANVVTGGYFGASATAAPSSSLSVATAAGPSNGAGRHASPASQSTSSSAYYYGAGASHRVGSASSGNHNANLVSQGSGSSSSNANAAVRYHTAASASDRAVPQRPTSATFDITNRVASAATTTVGSSSAVDINHQHNTSASQQQQQSSSSISAGMAARLTSPISSTTPGSGINVNATPYYYVSSRMRKQQQQQQQQQASAASPSSTEPSPVRPNTHSQLAVADTMTRPGVSLASVADNNADAYSSGSSFTSPACVNPPNRFVAVSSSTTATTTMSATSSGIEVVLSAMKRTGTTMLVDAQSGKLASSSSSAPNNAHVDATANDSGSHTFPARPIAKGMMMNSAESESATSTHMPRRSPQSAYQPPVQHRRATFPSQHSLGKKRSKPESYKDY